MPREEIIRAEQILNQFDPNAYPRDADRTASVIGVKMYEPLIDFHGNVAAGPHLGMDLQDIVNEGRASVCASAIAAGYSIELYAPDRRPVGLIFNFENPDILYGYSDKDAWTMEMQDGSIRPIAAVKQDAMKQWDLHGADVFLMGALQDGGMDVEDVEHHQDVIDIQHHTTMMHSPFYSDLPVLQKRFATEYGEINASVGTEEAMGIVMSIPSSPKPSPQHILVAQLSAILEKQHAIEMGAELPIMRFDPVYGAMEYWPVTKEMVSELVREAQAYPKLSRALQSFPEIEHITCALTEEEIETFQKPRDIYLSPGDVDYIPPWAQDSMALLQEAFAQAPTDGPDKGPKRD